MKLLGLLLAAPLSLSAHAYAQTTQVGPWSVDASGWTVPVPTTTTSGACGGPSATATGTCIYYVDFNTGTDDNANCIGYLPPVAVTPSTKCKTIDFAFSRMRSGKPDWMLLARGMTHQVGARILGNIPFILGQDENNPFLMSAYPLAPVSYDDRPLIDLVGTASADNSTIFMQFQGGGAFQAAFISLGFTISRLDPASPNYWNAKPSVPTTLFKILANPRNFLLVEDTKCTYGACGIQTSSNGVLKKNTYIRRNAWNNNAPGILAFLNVGLVDSLLFEENLLYKDYTTVYSSPQGVTISSASPAVITYGAPQTTRADLGGLPPFGDGTPNPPLIGLAGPVPTGLTTAAINCEGGGTCYYLCNIVGATANLSLSTACTPLINTSGSACAAGCTSIWSDPAATQYYHNVYIDIGWDSGAGVPGRNTIFRENISAYASSTGAQVRMGGTVYNNLFLKNPIDINGVSWPSEYSYNVQLQQIRRQQAISTTALSWGTDITSYRCAAPAFGLCTSSMVANPPNAGSSGTYVHHNILAQNEGPAGNAFAIQLEAYGFFNVGAGAWIEGATGVTVSNNVVCDYGTLSGKPYNNLGTGNTISSNNVPSGNLNVSCASLGLSPKSVADYYINILGGPGGSTTDDFLNAAMTKWTKISWDQRYMAKAVNAYIRPTYGIANPPDSRIIRLDSR